MLKIISEPRILDFNVSLSLKKLISETISTWSKKIPLEVEKELEGNEYEKRYNDILRATKEGYSSILEMPIIHIQAIIPRINTLALVSFYIGSNFLQQSLRYAMPFVKEREDKHILLFIPKSLKSKENKIVSHVEKGIKIYFDLIENLEVLKVRKPEEDARYHLPLGLGTFISANINLNHLTNMLAFIHYHNETKSCVPSIWEDFVYLILNSLEVEMKGFIEKVSKDIKLGKFYPNPYPFITPFSIKKIEKIFEKNGRNEVKLISYNLDSLKLFNKEEIKEIIMNGIKYGKFNEFSNVYFDFAIKESCVSRHQIIRHRTILQQSLSVYDAAKRKEIIIPSSIYTLKGNLLNNYFEYINETLSLYEELRDEDENDSVIILPSNIAFITTLRLDGYNIFNFRGFIGNRCCELAQTETQLIASLINNKINQILEKEGFKELTEITHANCFKLRQCPELIERAINCSIFQSKKFEKDLFK